MEVIGYAALSRINLGSVSFINGRGETTRKTQLQNQMNITTLPS